MTAEAVTVPVTVSVTVPVTVSVTVPVTVSVTVPVTSLSSPKAPMGASTPKDKFNKMASDENTSQATDAANPSPARLRAEARKQKILSKGNDRLAKITGAMKGSHTYIHSESG